MVGIGHGCHLCAGDLKYLSWFYTRNTKKQQPRHQSMIAQHIYLLAVTDRPQQQQNKRAEKVHQSSSGPSTFSVIPPFQNISPVWKLGNISEVSAIILAEMCRLGTVNVGQPCRTITYHIGEREKKNPLHGGGMVHYHPRARKMAEIGHFCTQRQDILPVKCDESTPKSWN